MEIIIEKGCGLDVHKGTVVGCIMGTGIKKEVKTYTAMTNDLLRLKEWLQEAGITHVAMESTGVYWKPVFNILEDSFEVILVNARHVKNVPGAGMSPGNNESAGKKKPDSTTYGNKCLKTMLTEFAWVASKTKDTYLRSKYHSLVGRRGKKKALVALGHKILIMCYHILKYRHPYKELGGDYLDQRRKDKITRSYIKRLNHLGYEVTLKEAA